MADPQAPPAGFVPAPPAGFQPVKSEATPPPPPPGFQPVASATDSAPPQEGLMSNILSGILQSAAETASGTGKIVEKGLEAVGANPDKQIVPAMQSPNVKGFSVPTPEGATPSTSVGAPGAGHTIGEGLEQVGEFAAGEGMLSDFEKMATKYPNALALMEKYPRAAKLLTEASKAAAVGGAQGAVKGAAQDTGAVKGAEGGAIGGAIGGAAGEGASQVLGDILKQLGIGTEAGQKAMQAMKPAKGNTRFLGDFAKAAPIIDALPDWREAKDAQEGVDAIRAARQDWWNKEVQPVIDKHSGYPLSGIALRDSIESQIPEPMKKFNPEKAADIQRFANEFMPGQIFQMTVGEAEKNLEHFNAELAATGFWNKSAAERNALLQTNPDIIKWKAAGDAIRDDLYNRLDILEPNLNMADKKITYGALRNVENQLQGRVNVEGRQAPISLKQAIGLAAGLSMGRLEGIAAATLPMVDRNYNSAINLAQRATKQAATGEEGTAAELAKAAAQKAPKLAAPAGTGVGRYYFRSSDGGLHSIPNTPEAIQRAKQIDPNLQQQVSPDVNNPEVQITQ